MNIFINACARNNSRTRMLAESYISGLEDDVDTINLYNINIPLLDERAIIERDNAVKSNNYSNPFISLATQFRDAQKIIIAAPYWDFGYPAILRSYLEAIMVNGITFSYDNTGNPHGHCQAKELIYITTAGGYIQNSNLGYEHIKALATKMLGIPRTIYHCLEGLDIFGADTETMIKDKKEELKVFAMMSDVISSEAKTIMVVDDSKVNIIKTEFILKELGYKTVSANSGEECLKQLRLNKIDIILLDIEMPQMNGFETIDAIRKNPEFSDIPVIFLTSDNTMDVIVKASQYNVSGYVTKPFTKETLMHHIDNAL